MSTDENYPVVLVGGSRGYNALSVARAFGRRGREIHLLLEARDESLAASSRFVRSTTCAPLGRDVADAWTEWCIGAAPEGSVIIPCADRGLEFMVRRRAVLVDAGLRPAAARDDVVLAMLDKQQSYEMARQVGIAVPRTETVTGKSQVLDVATTFELPFALKPRVSHLFPPQANGSKAIVIRSYSALERQVDWLVDAGLSMIVTEIIPGPEHSYCSYYTYLDDDGRPLVHFTKRKLRQYPVGFGEGSYHLTDWAPDVADMGLRFVSAIGLRGMANVEFKRDQRDGSLKLIECNARLTAANELVRRSGVDFAEIIYRGALGLPTDPTPTYRVGIGMWMPMHDLLAFRELRSSRGLGAVAWLASLCRPQVAAVLDARDPGPSWTKFTQLWRWARRWLTLRDSESAGVPSSWP